MWVSVIVRRPCVYRRYTKSSHFPCYVFLPHLETKRGGAAKRREKERERVGQKGGGSWWVTEGKEGEKRGEGGAGKEEGWTKKKKTAEERGGCGMVNKRWKGEAEDEGAAGRGRGGVFTEDRLGWGGERVREVEKEGGGKGVSCLHSAFLKWRRLTGDLSTLYPALIVSHLCQRGMLKTRRRLERDKRHVGTKGCRLKTTQQRKGREKR